MTNLSLPRFHRFWIAGIRWAVLAPAFWAGWLPWWYAIPLFMAFVVTETLAEEVGRRGNSTTAAQTAPQPRKRWGGRGDWTAL